MKYLYYALWLILLTLLQPTLICNLELFGIAPNLFLCFVVIAGFYRGVYEGGICGMVFGLVYDILLGEMIGINAMLYLYLGVGAGILGIGYFGGEKRLAITVSAGVGTLGAALVYYLVRKIAAGDISFVTAFFRIGLLEAIYQMPVAFLLSFGADKSMRWMKMEKIS